MLDETGDHALSLAAATGLLTQGEGSALGFVRDRLAAGAALEQGARYEYLRLLALAGTGDDLGTLHRALGLAPRDAELAGWYGHRGLVAWLLEALERSNELRAATGPWPHPMELAAVAALVRITGAELHDEPTDGVEYDFDDAPALFASTWSGWWRQNGDRFDPQLRYRFGQPYTPRATIAELLAPTTPAIVRSDLTLELAAALGPTPFEPTDWVARQRAVLASLQQRLEKDADKAYPAGAFLGNQLHRRSC
ncbi:MAG: hypothetical protein JRI23_19590 [Deltaproteobacteria bacterium]|jgi:hypothetical protein|nr:hypothetical protein [Deltaproteobacteria bacterium]MBW2534069.1 hypothetical protein [Deltaproteobacteria bacterium]